MVVLLGNLPWSVWGLSWISGLVFSSALKGEEVASKDRPADGTYFRLRLKTLFFQLETGKEVYFQVCAFVWITAIELLILGLGKRQEL